MITKEQIAHINFNQLYLRYPLGTVMQVPLKKKGLDEYVDVKATIIGYQFNSSKQLALRVLVRTKQGEREYTVPNMNLLIEPTFYIHDEIDKNVAFKEVNAISDKLLEPFELERKPERKPPKVEPVAKPVDFDFTGDEIRSARTDLNLSQVDLAVKLGLKESSAAAIGDWERDRIKVPVKHQRNLLILFENTSIMKHKMEQKKQKENE